LALIRAPGVELALPPVIAAAGEDAVRATLEFFMARIPNPNTRAAYGRAVKRFCDWCHRHKLDLIDVTSPDIAIYLEELGRELSVPSTKLQLAGVRNWLDWLTQRGVLAVNPAAAVRGQKHIVREGKTPVLERDDARLLFSSITGVDVVSLRDKAMLSVMLFGFARVGAVTKMRVGDFLDEGREAELKLNEKGGQHRVIPCHHITREQLRAYIVAAGLDTESKAPLFQSAPRHGKKLSGKPMSRADALAMVKRRCRAAGLPASICNHSFRATGITMHQEAGGRLEDAQLLAGHASTRTTQLYNRKARKIARAEVERVQL
jgi:site-specific recombinase XerD